MTLPKCEWPTCTGVAEVHQTDIDRWICEFHKKFLERSSQVNLPDDEKLLREVSGTKFRSPEEWAQAVEGPPPSEAQIKETIESWVKEVDQVQGPNPIRDTLTKTGPISYPPKCEEVESPLNLLKTFSRAEVDRIKREAKESEAKAVNAARDEERRRAMDFLDRFEKEQAERLPPEPKNIRDQIEEFEAAVEKKYPFPCDVQPCRARVIVEGSTCVLHGNMPPAPQSILQEAHRIVCGARNKAYGSPDVNHSFTAKLMLEWLKGRYTSAYPNDHLGEPRPNWPEEAICSFDAYDVCVFNMLQKLSRTAHQLRTDQTPHRDSLVDIAGYAANMDMIAQDRRNRGS